MWMPILCVYVLNSHGYCVWLHVIVYVMKCDEKQKANVHQKEYWIFAGQQKEKKTREKQVYISFSRSVLGRLPVVVRLPFYSFNSCSFYRHRHHNSIESKMESIAEGKKMFFCSVSFLPFEFIDQIKIIQSKLNLLYYASFFSQFFIKFLIHVDAFFFGFVFENEKKWATESYDA